MSDNEVGSTMRFLLWVGGVSAVIAYIDFYFQLPAPAGYGAQFIWVKSGVFRRAQGIFYEASTLGNLCAFLLELIAVSLVTGTSILQMKRRALLFLFRPADGCACAFLFTRFDSESSCCDCRAAVDASVSAPVASG